MEADQATAWGVHGSASLDDLQLDAAVLEGLLVDLESLLAGLQLGPLHGVHLQGFVQVLRIAPVPFVVVVADSAGLRVDDHGVLPARELDQQTRDIATEEFCGSLFWNGQS